MILQIAETTAAVFPTVMKANMAFVSSITVTPGNGASGHITLGVLNAEGEFVPAHSGYITVALTQEQFLGWGQDDQYAVKCVIENLGLTIIS